MRQIILFAFATQRHFAFYARCNEPEQLEKYLNLTTKLYLADENEIYELTDCLSTCEKFEYAVQPMTDLTITEENDKTKANTLRLQFYFTTGRHELREQVKYLMIL